MKYFRRYVAVALVCVSVTLIAAGVFAVNESARRISLGETQRVIVYGEQARVYEPAEVTDIEPQIKTVIETVVETKDRILQFLQDAVFLSE